MATSTAKRAQQHGQSLRAAGLRPIQIWVPDTRSAGFAQECARQSRVTAVESGEQELQEWLLQAADIDGWR